MKNSVAQTNSINVSITDFGDYFKAINNPEGPCFQPDEDILYFNERFLNSEIQTMVDELNCTISAEEISQAINRLKSGRSGAPDKFLNECFIYGLFALFTMLL